MGDGDFECGFFVRLIKTGERFTSIGGFVVCGCNFSVREQQGLVKPNTLLTFSSTVQVENTPSQRHFHIKVLMKMNQDLIHLVLKCSSHFGDFRQILCIRHKIILKGIVLCSAI